MASDSSASPAAEAARERMLPGGIDPLAPEARAALASGKRRHRIAHYGLVPVKTSAALGEAASAWPSGELFLVTHRARCARCLACA